MQDLISRQAAIESVADEIWHYPDEIHMIGYLSGPVTGNPDYKRQFAWAAKQLTRMGYDVINPAALSQVVPIEELSYDTTMEIDMLLLSKADYLIQLPGWENSRGANRELGYALATGKIVVSLEHLLKEGREQAYGPTKHF